MVMSKRVLGGADNGGEKTLSSVRLAFNIIEHLSDHGSCGVTDLSRALEIPKSTVHVHLKTLQAVGYVIKTGNDYRLSHRFLQIGGVLRQRNKLFQIADAELKRIGRQTGELAILVIEEEGRGVELHKLWTEESLDDNTPIGGYLPLHSTATGKAILAYLPEERVDVIIEHYGLPSVGPKTITDVTELQTELATIRDREYAITDEEHSAGVKAIATPILINGEVLGSIGVSGPSKRMTDDRLHDELAPNILESKNIIELRMRYYS